MHINVLIMKSISLFCCRKKVFTHMNTWMIGKKFRETLPEKEDFYSHLTMENTTDADFVTILK